MSHAMSHCQACESDILNRILQSAILPNKIAQLEGYWTVGIKIMGLNPTTVGP